MKSCFGKKKNDLIKLTHHTENLALQSVNEEDFERDKPFVFLEEDNLDDASLENETNFTVEAHQTAQNDAEFIKIMQTTQNNFNKFYEMLQKDEGLCHRSLNEDGDKALHIAMRTLRDTATITKPADLINWATDYVNHVGQEIIGRSPNQISMQNNNGETPILLLAASGLATIFAQIIKQLKVDTPGINIPDNQGNTPLHQVVLNAESLELAMFLVQKDANLMARNNEGLSPLFYAVQRGWPPASTEALEEEDLTEEKIQELNVESEKQSWYRKFFHASMKEKPRHPLEMVATGSDAEGDHKPFILAMWEASPVAANIIFQQLESDKSFERGVTYVKYNYAINQEGYNFMLSGGQEGVLHILENETGVFVKKAPIKAMLDCFWDHSIRKIVLMEMVVFLSVLISASVMINLGVVAKSAGDTENSVARKVAASIFGGFVVLGTSILLATETYHATHQGFGYIQDYWNYPDWISSITIMYMSLKYLITWQEWNDWERNVLAVGILYMWMKTLEFASAFEKTSGIARLFLRMLHTIFQYLVMILIFILAFSHSFFLVLSDSAENYSDVPKSMITLYRGMMGDFSYDDIQNSDSFLATILFIAFTLTGVILLLNLLIALMTNVYEEVLSDIETAYLQSKANMIAKKLRVYILGSSTTTILHKKLLLPNLHEWQLPLPEENKMDAVQKKWAQFLRATLFRPDRFQLHPNYKEWFQGEEYHYGVVIYPIKNDQGQNQEMQIQGLRTKISQTSAKLNKQLGGIKDQVKAVKTDIEGSQSTLATLRDKATVADVAKQLLSTNDSIKEKALEHVQLVKPKDEKILAALLQITASSNSNIRRLTIQALGALQMVDDRVQEVMLKALNDEPVRDIAMAVVCNEEYSPSPKIIEFLITAFKDGVMYEMRHMICRVVMKYGGSDPAVIDIVLFPFADQYWYFNDKDRETALQLIVGFEEDEKVADCLLKYISWYYPSSELVIKMVETFGNLAPYVRRFIAPPEATPLDYSNNRCCFGKGPHKDKEGFQAINFCYSCYRYVCNVCRPICHDNHYLEIQQYNQQPCDCAGCKCVGLPNDELRERVVQHLNRYVAQEGNRPVKLVTVTALKKIGNYPSVYAALEIAMNDRDDAVRSAALQNMLDLARENTDAQTFLMGILYKLESGHLARACTATIFQQLYDQRHPMPDEVKEGLKKGLRDRYWAVRANSASALCTSSMNDAILEDIVRLVRDKKPQVSVAALNALNAMSYKSTKLVPTLLELVQVTDSLDLKCAIVHTLSKHQERGGYFMIPSAIKNTISNQDADFAICAQESYCELVVESSLYHPREVILKYCNECGQKMCQVCVQCHKGHADQITIWAQVGSNVAWCECPHCECRTVDTNTQLKVKRTLVKILASRPAHKQLVLNCIAAIPKLGAKDESSGNSIVPFLTDSDAQIKMAAIDFCVGTSLTTPQVLQHLIEGLSDDLSDVRIKASDSLIALGQKNSDLLLPLIHIINTGKTFGKINAVIAISSLQIEDPRIHETFIKCLRTTDDADLRTWVTHSWRNLNAPTGTIRTKGIYALVEAHQGEMYKFEPLREYWQVSEEEYINLLINMLTYESGSVRRAAAVAFSKANITDLPKVLAALKQALNDADETVKKAAQASLKHLSGKQS